MLRRKSSGFAWSKLLSRIVIPGFAYLLIIAFVSIRNPGWTIFGFDSLYVVVGLLIVGEFFALRSRQTEDLLAKVRRAIRLQDFQRVVDLSRSVPKVFHASPHLRHNLALATDMLGDRELAISMYEELRKEMPWFKLSWFNLAGLYLEVGNPLRAKEIACEIANTLNADAGGHLLVACASRRLNELDPADIAIPRALMLAPKPADIVATVAGIALDRGECGRAVEMIANAEKLDPDSAYVMCVKAQIALRTESPEMARPIAERAIAVVRANRRTAHQYEAALLETAIADLSK
jgi:predicted Zn-dependent protease